MFGDPNERRMEKRSDTFSGGNRAGNFAAQQSVCYGNHDQISTRTNSTSAFVKATIAGVVSQRILA